MIQGLKKGGLHYTHDVPESIVSRLLKLFFVISGWKKSIEKDMRRGQIKQDAAPIPSSLIKNLDIDWIEIKGRKVWKVGPRKNVSEKIILYLHGGAYVYNIQKVHWQYIEKLIKRTGATFVVPDYPLAPASNGAEVLSFLHLVQANLVENYKTHKISFMGDSAGAGLALALAQSLRDSRHMLPRQLVLLSPWLDVTMSNPEIPQVDRYDKVLGMKGLQLAGASYAGELDPRDHVISPIFGDFRGLPTLSIFIGTHDLFIADSRKLKRRLESQQIPLNYYEYPKMIHVWAIIPGLVEANHSTDQIVKLIIDE